MFVGLVDDRTLKKLSLLKFKFGLEITSQFEGLQKSKGHGNSVEFSDHREYMPGDDFRKVNFRIFAATQRLYVKLFEQERQTTFNFFIDMSKSMDFGSKVKKGDMAKALAFCLSYIALSQLDSCCIFLVGENDILSSGYLRGKQSLQKITKFLEDADFKGEANFKNLKNIYIPRKSVSFVFSDFLFEDADQFIKILAERSSYVSCCQILDEIEDKPSFDHVFCQLIDSENERSLNLELTENLVKEYMEELKRYQNRLREILRKANGRFYKILTSDEIEKTVTDLLGVGK